MGVNRLPILSFEITLLVMSIVMIIRYFLMSSIFISIIKLLKIAPIESVVISSEQIKRDILWSIMSSLIFALVVTIMIKLWQSGMTQIYYDLSDYPWWYSLFSLGLYFFCHDTYFYWSHRLLHLFQYHKVHYVHHESRIPTAWTSFAFHPLEALVQAIVLPALIVLIPIHIVGLIVFFTMMSIFGVMNHLGVELYPLILERKFFLISASHHQQHHRKVSVNFALYFTFWDKWMKTEFQSERMNVR